MWLSVVPNDSRVQRAEAVPLPLMEWQTYVPNFSAVVLHLKLGGSHCPRAIFDNTYSHKRI